MQWLSRKTGFRDSLFFEKTMHKYTILSMLLGMALFCFACKGDPPEKPDEPDIDLGAAFFPSTVTRKIDRINPETQENGGRGANELIIYTHLYGKKTNTNPYGVEAIVEDGIVVHVGGNDSEIPDVGLVISGHGTAARWINQKIQVGAEIKLENYTLQVIKSENTLVEQGRGFIRTGKERLKTISHPSIDPDRADALENAFDASVATFVKAKQAGDSASVEALAQACLSKGKDFFYYSFPSRPDDERAAWLEIQGMSKDELEAVFADLADIGFNTVCPEVIYRGWAIFPNAPNGLAQYPCFVGRDPMQEMIELGRKYDITVVPWVWVFFVGSEHFDAMIKAKPEWLAISRKGKYPSEVEAGFHYFCPSRDLVREYWLEIYDYMISTYELGHLQLDYIRYPGEPWTNDYCYCDTCRNRFMDQFGVDPLDLSPDNTPELWASWDKFRENNVTRFVEAVSQRFPQVDLSADVVPDQEYSLEFKKQNWSKWLDNDWLNTVYIMAYTSDVDLVDSYIGYMEGRMKPSQRGIVGLGPYTGMKPEILVQEIELARTREIDGSCLFIYNALSDQQKDALKKGPYRQDN